ncbi:MAG: hypothetical protein NTAFB09_20040 [Nitrosospira sp.]
MYAKVFGAATYKILTVSEYCRIVRTVANAVNLFPNRKEGNQMSEAKFKRGSKVIIARPTGNQQLKGREVKIIDGPSDYWTESGWMPGYAIRADRRLFVAAESELEAV